MSLPISSSSSTTNAPPPATLPEYQSTRPCTRSSGGLKKVPASNLRATATSTINRVMRKRKRKEVVTFDGNSDDECVLGYVTPEQAVKRRALLAIDNSEYTRTIHDPAINVQPILTTDVLITSPPRKLTTDQENADMLQLLKSSHPDEITSVDVDIIETPQVVESGRHFSFDIGAPSSSSPTDLTSAGANIVDEDPVKIKNLTTAHVFMLQSQLHEANSKNHRLESEFTHYLSNNSKLSDTVGSDSEEEEHLHTSKQAVDTATIAELEGKLLASSITIEEMKRIVMEDGKASEEVISKLKEAESSSKSEVERLRTVKENLEHRLADLQIKLLTSKETAFTANRDLERRLAASLAQIEEIKRKNAEDGKTTAPSSSSSEAERSLCLRTAKEAAEMKNTDLEGRLTVALSQIEEMKQNAEQNLKTTSDVVLNLLTKTRADLEKCKTTEKSLRTQLLTSKTQHSTAKNQLALAAAELHTLKESSKNNDLQSLQRQLHTANAEITYLKTASAASPTPNVASPAVAPSSSTPFISSATAASIQPTSLPLYKLLDGKLFAKSRERSANNVIRIRILRTTLNPLELDQMRTGRVMHSNLYVYDPTDGSGCTTLHPTCFVVPLERVQAKDPKATLSELDIEYY